LSGQFRPMVVMFLGKLPSGTHRIGVWVGYRSSLDAEAKTLPPPKGNPNQVVQAQY